ncbi:MAG TPA: ATP-dependent DNA ligase, partial [Bryobacteraceae bacterium]|nr:ATP-dependent DNA ligase [Bryobacteraceae bacterium]
MLLADIVETSRRLSQTSRRLAKIELLAELLKRLSPEEIEIGVLFLSGAIRQAKLGVGYAGLRNATGIAAAVPTLQLTDVDASLSAIAAVRGSGSERLRRELLTGLLRRATGEEQEFLIRLITGELRQGALEGLMVEALAKASGAAAGSVRRAVMMAGNLGCVASVVLAGGEAGLAQYNIQLFRPVQPMLANTAEDVGQAMQDLGEAALEWKFDGARVQVHRSGEEVRVYSRRLNDVTAAVPEIVESVRRLPVRDLILDGEVLSLQPDGRPQPFQVTMRRFGRKLNVDGMRAELPLTPFWFDLLYMDGESLADESQSRRFQTLREIASEDLLVPNLVTAVAARAEEFLRDALARGHEGIMAKATNAPYAAGARGQSWLKLKQARTLDLVVLAAEWGNGRRQGLLSNLHLGARDTEKGGFAMLGKTFK